MAEKKSVVLTGNDLTVEQIIAVGVGDLKVELDEQALQRCRDSPHFPGRGGQRASHHLRCQHVVRSHVQQDYR